MTNNEPTNETPEEAFARAFREGLAPKSWSLIELAAALNNPRNCEEESDR